MMMQHMSSMNLGPRHTRHLVETCVDFGVLLVNKQYDGLYAGLGSGCTQEVGRPPGPRLVYVYDVPQCEYDQYERAEYLWVD